MRHNPHSPDASNKLSGASVVCELPTAARANTKSRFNAIGSAGPSSVLRSGLGNLHGGEFAKSMNGFFPIERIGRQLPQPLVRRHRVQEPINGRSEGIPAEFPVLAFRSCAP